MATADAAIATTATPATDTPTIRPIGADDAVGVWLGLVTAVVSLSLGLVTAVVSLSLGLGLDQVLVVASNDTVVVVSTEMVSSISIQKSY